ncbi:MAG TPA: sigma-70 family RNA polymerase sigma factor [Kofleriaceae bacterium]
MLGVDTPALEDAAQAACRAALRAGLRDADARDLAQDALVRALTSAQPPGGVPLAAWVYGIARNLGRDHAKSARSRELLVDVVPDAADDGDPATILAVRRAVHELPESLRDIITLHELEELSLRETAEALAIPFDTAKDRLRRAREQLRTRLGDADYSAERSHTRRRAANAGAAIVIAVLAAVGERGAAAATAALAARGLVVRAWLAAAIGAAFTVGGFAVGRLTAPRDRVPVAIAAAPEAARVDPPPPPPAPVPPPPSPAPQPVAKPAAPAPKHAATADPDHAAERLLLDRARAALQRGLPDEALVALMSHERQFPAGALAEERDVLTIEAYVVQGNAELAHRRIARYRAQHPDGALRSRVDAAAAQVP